jgi:hypothetical protein
VVGVEAWSSRPPSSQGKPSRPGPRGARSFFRWELHLAPLGPGPLPGGRDEGERDDQAGDGVAVIVQWNGPMVTFAAEYAGRPTAGRSARTCCYSGIAASGSSKAACQR